MKDTIELLKAGAEGDYIGEPVSQLEHALQAALAAENAGASEGLILAALLHDIGHWCVPETEVMPGLGAVDHERLGADYVRDTGLNPDIATLIEMHVDAKRYLAALKPAYLEKLSPASTATLQWQGGPMTPAQIEAFEQHPFFRDALRLRAWDEAAKETDIRLPGVEYYRAMLNRNRLQPIEEIQLEQWQQEGLLHVKGWFDLNEMRQIESTTRTLQQWPESAGEWMKYFEIADEKRLLCRIENFLQYNPLFNEIAYGSAATNLLALLMGEPVALFKEKINFKLPGGQGFAPHQDAPAFTSFGQHYHITMMLSIDATTVDNGCLEIVPGHKQTSLLSMNDDLTLAADVVESMNWVPVETEPGDLVLFDSYLPHRSGPNRSANSRRALYATYNRFGEGAWRDAYFEAKRKSFPPDVEKVPGKQYDAGVFNVGNPVNTG